MVRATAPATQNVYRILLKWRYSYGIGPHNTYKAGSFGIEVIIFRRTQEPTTTHMIYIYIYTRYFMYGGDNIAIMRTANQRFCFLVFRRDDDRFVSFTRMDKGNLEIMTSAEVTPNFFFGDLPQMPFIKGMWNYYFAQILGSKYQNSKQKHCFLVRNSTSDASILFRSGSHHDVHVHHVFLHRMAVFFEKIPPLALRVWDDFAFFWRHQGGHNWNLGKHHYRLCRTTQPFWIFSICLEMDCFLVFLTSKSWCFWMFALSKWATR